MKSGAFREVNGLDGVHEYGERLLDGGSGHGVSFGRMVSWSVRNCAVVGRAVGAQDSAGPSASTSCRASGLAKPRYTAMRASFCASVSDGSARIDCSVGATGPAGSALAWRSQAGCLRSASADRSNARAIESITRIDGS